MGEALGQRPALGRYFGKGRGSRQRTLVKAPAKAAGLADLDLDGGVQLLPDARHAQEQRGRDLAQVGLDGAQALGKVHHRARAQRQMNGVDLLGHMAQRQVRHGGVRRRAAVDGVGARGHGGDVAVADHRGLGAARGAAGEDHQRGVLQGLRRQALLHHARPLGLEGGAQGAHFLEGQQVVNVVAAQALGVDHHHMGQRGQAFAHLKHLVQLLLVFTHHHGGVAGLEQVFHLRRGRGGVHPHRDRAHQAAAQLGEHPFLAVLADDGAVAAFGQAQLDQAQAKVARRLFVARPGDGLPDAVVLLAQRHRRRARGGPVAQLLRQGQAVDVHGGHVAFVQGQAGAITTASACGACSASRRGSSTRPAHPRRSPGRSAARRRRSRGGRWARRSRPYRFP